MAAESSTATTIKIDDPVPWIVVCHNDDFTPMDFVIGLLQNLFDKSEADATRIALNVHESGSAVVGRYTKEVAKSKAMLAVGLAESEGHPLLVTAAPEE